MFKLIENDFLNRGICKYEDESKNTIFIKRMNDYENNDGFTAKLRFNQGDLKISSVVVHYPMDRSRGGLPLDINKPNGYCITKEEYRVLEEFVSKVVYWDDMIYNIKLLQLDNNAMKEILLSNAVNSDEIHKIEKMTDEEFAKEKLRKIVQFEELKSIMEMALSV